MTHKERLAEIEANLEGASWRTSSQELDDIDYLLTRVKKLTEALEFYSFIERYEPSEDWVYNGEDEVGVNGPSCIAYDEGKTAREALSEDE